MYACFVDFSKALDTVWRKGLLYKLMLHGLSYKFIKLIESMYQGIKTSFNYCSSGSGQNSVIPAVCDVPE